VQVPAVAVQVSGMAGTVFVVHDDVLERRTVRVGAAAGDELGVLSGLAPGERVAIGDLDKLRDGAKVRVEP
jgi:multidrug efflux pump subunit AcrA (membrane-fusion protein)